LLILDRDDPPMAGNWVQRIRQAQTPVDYQVLAGYRELMISPHQSVVPPQLTPVALKWLERLGRRHCATVAPPAQKKQDVPTAPVMHLAAGRVRESAVFLGEDVGLFGIVTESTDPAPSRRAVLLLNAGATHHIGASRLNVTLARELALTGHVVLRIDQAGLGESPPRPGEPENVVYAPHAVEDVATAVSYLRNTRAASEIVVVGLCSGAYHALKVAVSGAELAMVIPINPLTFFWKEGMLLDVEYSTERVFQDAARYRRNLFRPSSWKRLLTGGVSIRDAVQVLARRTTAAFESLHMEFARLLGIRLKEDLTAELQEMAARGIRMHFLFAEGDPGLELLRTQGGRTVTRLEKTGQLAVVVIPGGDHTFTPRVARTRLIQHIVDLLRPKNPG
jgi:pimeloyl-ACP methyl ester carboxylesterase